MLAQRLSATALSVAVCAAPAYAHPTVVATLGTAPLVGPIASSAQMRDDVREHPALFGAAARRLGATSAEFRRFQVAVAGGDYHYVVIPRHLDAMSWSGGNGVHVIHDVVIPAHTYGWEVDVPEGDRVAAFYVPNVCGNLSLIRRGMPRVALRPKAVTHVAPPPVAAAPPVVAPPPEAAAPPVEAPVPVAAAPEVVATPVPPLAVPPAAKPHYALLGFLAPLAALLFGGGGGSGTSSSGGGGGMPCP